MERAQVLIDKLVQQQKQGDSITQMLLTVQLLQNELQALQQNSKPSSAAAKVAVVMPSRHAVTTVHVDAPKEIKKPAIPVETPAPAEPQRQPEVAAEVSPLAAALPEIPAAAEKPLVETEPAPERYILRELPVEELKNRPEPEPAKPAFPHLPDAAHFPDSKFDAMAETPTLVQHQQVKEIHELLGEQKESLNDKLKQEKVELAHLLKTTPIKDLRKAIGLNDKFAFINDLFRGDESMYERSIKTINSFHILQEAEYWINRELKVKLGWNDDKEVVQHFYHLVKRRFS